jgi:hypothetical protein
LGALVAAAVAAPLFLLSISQLSGDLYGSVFHRPFARFVFWLCAGAPALAFFICAPPATEQSTELYREGRDSEEKLVIEVRVSELMAARPPGRPLADAAESGLRVLMETLVWAGFAAALLLPALVVLAIRFR